MDSERRNEAKWLLRFITDTPIREYSTRDFGRQRYDKAVSTIVAGRSTRETLRRLHFILPAGLVAFIGTIRWLGDERHNGYELVVTEGRSFADIIYAADVYPANYNLNVDDVVKQMQRYNKWCNGIRIFHAQVDSVSFRISRVPDDFEAFVKDMHHFCPDSVDQGIGSLESWQQQIQKTYEVHFWWD